MREARSGESDATRSGWVFKAALHEKRVLFRFRDLLYPSFCFVFSLFFCSVGMIAGIWMGVCSARGIQRDREEGDPLGGRTVCMPLEFAPLLPSRRLRGWRLGREAVSLTGGFHHVSAM